MTQQRNTDFDILRTMAFLGVIIQHILGAYARREGLRTAEQMAILAVFEGVRFAVPLFVVLFAAALFYTDRKSVSPIAYYKKRIWQIGIPYFLWSVIYMIDGKTYDTITDFAKQLIRNLILGSASYHLWYVVMILQFCFFAPWILKIRHRLKEKQKSSRFYQKLTVFAIGFALLYLAVTPKLQFNRWTVLFFFRYRSLVSFSWILFFTIGVWYGANPQRYIAWVKRHLLPLGAMALLAEIGAFYLGLSAILQKQGVAFSKVSFLNPIFGIGMAAIISLLLYLIAMLPKYEACCRFCKTVSKLSYTGYLCHVFCLSHLSKYFVTHFPNMPYCILYFLLLLGTIFASLLLSGILQRLKNLLYQIHKQ